MKLTTMIRALRLVPLALALGNAGFAAAQAGPVSGVDSAGFDASMRPQDDLFGAGNGGWLKKTEIPADKSRFGTFDQLADLSDRRLRTIVEGLAATPQKAGSTDQKIADYYRAFIDTAAIDKAGLAPLRSRLDSIDAIKSRSELSAWLGSGQSLLRLPVAMGMEPDAKDPGINLAQAAQGGLGLPDRDYYLLTDDARLAKARAAYLAYLTRLGQLSGDKHAAASAEQVMALELLIAKAHWAKVELRDPVKSYNPMAPKALTELAPGMDWPAFLQAAELGGIERLSVMQPNTLTAVAKLVGEAPLSQWQAYLRLHLIDSSASLLPKPYRDASFGFHQQALAGAKAEKARWKQGIDEVNNALGEAVGQAYLARYFPPAAKARMQALVGNLLAAYKASIDGLAWMAPATKAAAQEKLAKYTTKIAYPERWRDYSKLVVKPGDALGNSLRAARFEYERQARQAGKPVDRGEWGMTPQTVNAYYNPSLNEIVFPAAILQPPFFDMGADDAVNYGAIGAGIGHEISHGFDDEGSQYDGDGRLRNWWTDADRAAFDAIGAKLVAQYETYEPLPGKHLNGKLTLGENIADLSGLQIAFKAYQRSLGSKPSPVIGGMTGEQRFFYGWAQVWRAKTRDERALQLLSVDPHSPPAFRVNGAAVNHDGFHGAFGTKPGDGMFKADDQRIRIW
ncbi:M13 family metallopeptidase [soil metagenome]